MPENQNHRSGPMRVAIVGSRDFKDLGLIRRCLQCFMQASGESGAPVELVSGDARGPDSEAERFAWSNRIPITVHKADWDKHGMQAGFVRNANIVADADLVMAFWDGSSHGTKDTMDRTLAARKTLYVFFDSRGDAARSWEQVPAYDGRGDAAPSLEDRTLQAYDSLHD